MRIVRYVGKNGCQASAYRTGISSSNPVVIDVFNCGNVTFNAKRDKRPLQLSLSPFVQDFVDLAVSVYISDELMRRGESADGWTRQFELLFPVQDPKAWSRVKTQLGATLSILSGDKFSFYFEKLVSIPSRGRHRVRVPRGYDMVCLFSGGIDSLVGAYNLLRSGKKVILVAHQADSITASTQIELFDTLRKMFPGKVSFIQCRVARSQTPNPLFALPDKLEDSHRSRSFLFLCLAVGVASATGIDHIIIPENGLIALNVPLQLSRLGTLSTRTAHPLYLMNFLKTVHKLGVFKGKIKNPFLYESKSDILQGIDSDLRELLPRTVSCSHPDVRRWTGAGSKKHCGYCVPCLYRRTAMAEARIDDQNDYIYDVFRDLSSLSSTKQTDFRALVRFARKISAMTDIQRQSIVLSHGVFLPNIGKSIGPSAVKDYSLWSSMLIRWAQDFLQKVDYWCSDNTKRILGL